MNRLIELLLALWSMGALAILVAITTSLLVLQ